MSKLLTTSYKGVYKRQKNNGDWSFYIKYRDENQKSIRAKVDSVTPKKASIELMEMKLEIQKIKDGLVAKPLDTKCDTMNELADIFFSGRDKISNTTDMQRYSNHVANVLGGVKHPISDLQAEKLQSALRKNVGDTTVNIITDLVRSIINYGMKHKLVRYFDGNPFSNLTRLQVDNARQRVFGKSELDSLFSFNGLWLTDDGIAKAITDGVDYDTKRVLVPQLSMRNLLVLMLGYYTGSRPKSYFNLVGSDIEVESRDANSDVFMKPVAIHFRGLKGGKDYKIPVSPKLVSILWSRLLDMDSMSDKVIDGSYEGIKKALKPIFDFLFNGYVDMRSRVWYGDGYSGGRDCNTMVRFNGLNGKIDPITDVKFVATLYSLRHTAGTTLVARTGDMLMASKLLGHSNLATTQRYVKMADDKLKEGVDLL